MVFMLIAKFIGFHSIKEKCNVSVSRDETDFLFFAQDEVCWYTFSISQIAISILVQMTHLYGY